MRTDITVYLHLNPQNSEVFYVGIGNRQRPTRFKNRSVFWNNYTNKYGKPLVYVLKDDCTWEEAVMMEISLIEHYKRICDGGCLVNLTLGGEGTLGYHPTEETLQKKRGKIVSEETRKKLSIAGTGRLHKPESIQKCREAKAGKPFPQQAYDRMMELIKEGTFGMAGKKHPLGTILKMRESQTGSKNHAFGKKRSESAKAATADKLRGRKRDATINDKIRQKRSMAVIDTATQIVYPSGKVVAELFGIHRSRLSLQLSGKKKNNTTFCYLSNYNIDKKKEKDANK